MRAHNKKPEPVVEVVPEIVIEAVPEVIEAVPEIVPEVIEVIPVIEENEMEISFQLSSDSDSEISFELSDDSEIVATVDNNQPVICKCCSHEVTDLQNANVIC